MDEKEFSVLHHLRGSGENAAMDFLSSLLGSIEAGVDLMHVEERLPDINDDSRSEFVLERREEEKEVEQDQLMSKALAKLKENEPDFSISSIRTSGDPVEEVWNQLDSKDYDLLSLEAYGRGGFRKNILGAHVNELVQKSEIPTLVHKGDLRSCERALIHVPNDRERCAGLVKYFGDLFKGSGLKITFLSILPDEDEKFEGYISAEEDYMKESIEDYDREEFGYLELAEEILEERDMEAEVRYRVGDIQEEILTEAREGRYDLMGFFSEEESFLTNLWTGDKSLKLMQEIDISLLKYAEKD